MQHASCSVVCPVTKCHWCTYVGSTWVLAYVQIERGIDEGQPAYARGVLRAALDSGRAMGDVECWRPARWGSCMSDEHPPASAPLVQVQPGAPCSPTARVLCEVDGCGSAGWEGTCPFNQEVFDDNSECVCCDSCRKGCADEI